MDDRHDIKQVLRLNVLARRADLGWSQAMLAERAGLSRPVLSAVEQGYANPTLAVLGRLAAAVGARTADLLTRPKVRRCKPRPSRLGRKPSFRRWLEHPPLGSKTAAAREFGVDLSLLGQTLVLTPEQRLERLARGASTLTWLRKAR